jgi:hypothetical protein
MTMTAIKRGTVIRFTPIDGQKRVTVLVDFVSLYDSMPETGFIYGHRCNEKGIPHTKGRMNVYQVRRDALIEVQT